MPKRPPPAGAPDPYAVLPAIGLKSPSPEVPPGGFPEIALAPNPDKPAEAAPPAPKGVSEPGLLNNPPAPEGEG